MKGKVSPRLRLALGDPPPIARPEPRWRRPITRIIRAARCRAGFCANSALLPFEEIAWNMKATGLRCNHCGRIAYRSLCLRFR